MQQQLVYLHTDKNLEETEEILKQQGMEIILRSNSLSLNFSDMTEEEQVGYLKTIEVDMQNAADKLELQEKQIEILARKGNSFSKELREIFNSLKNSRNTNRIKHFQYLQEEFRKVQGLVSSIEDLRYRSRDIRLNDSIRCSCLIAKMGTDVIRYLSFEEDPVLTITGPNATNLKSTLESKF